MSEEKKHKEQENESTEVPVTGKTKKGRKSAASKKKDKKEE